MKYILNNSEIEILFRQNPSTKDHGGWQSFLVKLQNQFNRDRKEIYLDSKDISRIQKYAFKYGNGGWESRLREIFGRVLGNNLGK